jgi:hypothetical protein
MELLLISDCDLFISTLCFTTRWMMCLDLKEGAEIILWCLCHGWTHGYGAGVFKSSYPGIYPVPLSTDGRLMVFKQHCPAVRQIVLAPAYHYLRSS